MKQLCFGDIVVVDGDKIGVVVKCWGESTLGHPRNYDVYVRMYNAIENYTEDCVDRYMVRHKYLDEEELQYQDNAIMGW